MVKSPKIENMVEADNLSPVAVKAPALAPKALIHQKFGSKACYRIEEVKQPVENSCPGLAVAQKFRSLYRCYLDLPDLSVMSDPFPRKKEAEHAAARIAIEKLGIQSKGNNSTPQEALDELVLRLTGFFTDEMFLSSGHPLVGHIKVAFKRAGDSYGMLPMSAIAACDTKVNNLCKVINPKAESEPLLVLSLILRATRMSASICIADGELWMGKTGCYPAEFFQLVKNNNSASTKGAHVEALFIPCSRDRDVETLMLNFSDCQYYMDEIARELHVRDSSRILMSRIVGKASSEMRFYFAVPDVPFFTSDSAVAIFPDVEGNINLETNLNERASYLSGQNIYGDAIMAHVGYTWKSSNLFYEDVDLSTYYRMIIGKLPDGHYKLSREGILSVELPAVFTTRSNWKGPLPRDLLCVFCRQHQLSEPLFSIKTLDITETSAESCEVNRKSKLSRLVDKVEMVNGDQGDVICGDMHKTISTFRCEVKIFSKGLDPVVECSFDDTHRKEYDAIQSAALKVLAWLNRYLKQSDIPTENLSDFGYADGIVVDSSFFLREFAAFLSINDLKNKSATASICKNQPTTNHENSMILCKIDGPDSGMYLSPGSVTSISYCVALLKKDEPLKEVLESKDEFEFEIGIGAVISELESCVNQLTVNQSAQFIVELPSRDLILAAAGQSAKHLSQLSLYGSVLEYSVKLLQVMEPLEDRIEQAFFSPPLSKQRVEFAVCRINESHATSLVDFGCGSGSLLDSLLDHTTTLEKVAGVDISRKSLIRAAKILHLKLNGRPSKQKNIRSAVLYDGSITDFDSRLYEFDIGTCLEVIEHMEEDQACLFGDVVLSLFHPGLLIVSTPNYEYNSILQRSSLPNREDLENKATLSKFRNHDHKFEWTRQQFQLWANNLAARHLYTVEFSGVGGSGDIEPGFASQIAVFKRSTNQSEKEYLSTDERSQPFEIIWEWSNGWVSA